MDGRKPAGGSRTSNGGAFWVVSIIVLLVMISNSSRCSPSTTATSAGAAVTSDATARSLASAVAEQKPPAVEPLDGPAIKTGVADMAKSLATEGLSGAMIFSQNCYDALSRAFAWRLLDVCGSADQRAIATVPEDEAEGPTKEVTYFQSETMAGRYLAAATGAGMSPDEADRRLAELQQRVPQPTPKPTEEATESPVGDAGETPVANAAILPDANPGDVRGPDES